MFFAFAFALVRSGPDWKRERPRLPRPTHGSLTDNGKMHTPSWKSDKQKCDISRGCTLAFAKKTGTGGGAPRHHPPPTLMQQDSALRNRRPGASRTPRIEVYISHKKEKRTNVAPIHPDSPPYADGRSRVVCVWVWVLIVASIRFEPLAGRRTAMPLDHLEPTN